MTASLGSLVMYNWDPETQLSNFLAAAANVVDDTPGGGPTIAFLGDSTTDGFGTAASNYIATTSLPAQVAAGLAADGVAANQADFMGQGNELALDTDARVTLLRDASWNFPIAAGGEIVRFNAIGDGVSFTPDSSGSYQSVTLDYIDAGGATLDVNVNGLDVGDVTTGNSGLLDQVTVRLPTAQAVSSVTITDVNGATAYLEGVTLQSATPSVQVIDAGVGGAESSIVGTGQPEATPYNLTSINAVAAQKPTVAFVDFGINDVLQGNLTAAQTTANLQLIVQELRAVGTEPIIVIPNPITATGWGTEIATLRADVYALATQMNIPVIDLSASSGDDASTLEAAGLLNTDGIHPTAAYDAAVGHEIAALLTASLSTNAGGTTAISGSSGTSTPPNSTQSGSTVLATPAGTRTVIAASAFLGSIGVDTHIPYTDGGYANISNVLADLQFIGVSNVRDGLSDGDATDGQANGSAPLSSFETLAKAGVKFTTVIGAGGSWTPQAVQQTLSLDNELQQAVPGTVTAVEGVNEINNAPVTWIGANGVGVSGLQAAVDLQGDLYAAVHADTNLAGVAVDYFTGYSAGSDGAGPDPATQAGLADFDTQHPYPQSADAAYWVAPTTTLTNEPGTQGAAVYTETGYSTDTVSQLAQARGDLNILMDDAKNGVTETFLYQLLDAYQAGSAQGDDGFGLFGPSNQPKLAATALHDLTTILADPGASSTRTVSAPDFTVIGLPSDGSTLAIEKSDGTQDFVVWNEISGSQAVTVNLGADYQSVSVYDPLQGSTPIETSSDVSSVALTLNGSPLIVEVSPKLAPATPLVVGKGTGSSTGSTPDTSPPVVTVGSGPDKLILQISQDYYLGDASFTVDVNGQQIGGIQTVSELALHSNGIDQTYDILGNFSASQAVSVNFINDVYAGTPQTDRNLYVDSATIKGTLVSGAADAIYGDWTDTFSVIAPTATGTASTGTSTTGSTTTTTTASGPSGSAPMVNLGSGPDTLTLQVSQDYYLGSAQYVVDVNGLQVGGVQTVDSSVSQSAGTSQTVSLSGNFSGDDQVSVSFLNDLYAGTPETDRNLYVDSASLNGTAITGSSLAIDGDWTQGFSFQHSSSGATGSGAASSSTTDATTSSTNVGTGSPVVNIGSGPDTLALQVSQDYYLGSAQFVIDVDGQQVGGVQTVDSSALHSTGAEQTFDVLGTFAGATDVTVNFLNDADAGTPETDRNLYVDNVSIDGAPINSSTLYEYGNGPQSFSFVGPEQTATSPDIGLYLSGTAGAEAQWSIDDGALSSDVQPTSGSTAQGFDIGSLTPGLHDLALYQVPNSAGGTAQAINVSQITVGSTVLSGLQYGTLSSAVTHFELAIPATV